MTANPEAPASTQAKKPPRLALLVATGFGLGYLPLAPGTWGSLAGTAVAILLWWPAFGFTNHLAEGAYAAGSRIVKPPWLLNAMFGFLHLVLVGVTVVTGVWSAGKAAKHFAQKDPQVVVIDEISGQLVTYLALAAIPLAGEMGRPVSDIGWKYLLAGFILFRVFDIWKPWPARQAEKLASGWGIMADDWVAGLYAGAGLLAMRAAGF